MDWSVVSGGAWLVILGGRIGGTAPLDALRSGVDWMLLTKTQFGLSWICRAATALLLGLALLPRRPPTSLGAFAVALGAVLAGSLAWSGHGAATPGLTGDLQLAADIVHLIASAVWLGGLLPFAVVLLLAARGEIPPGSAADITKGFSTLAALSVAFLVLTGTFNGWVLIRSFSGLNASLYGRLLLTKVGLFLVMLCFAAVNRVVLAPRLARAAGGVPPQIRQIAAISLVELALGLAVVSIVGLLGTLPPAGDHRMTSGAGVPGRAAFGREDGGGSRVGVRQADLFAGRPRDPR